MEQRQKKITTILVVVAIIVGAFMFFARKAADTAIAAQEELNRMIEPMLWEMASSDWDREVFESYSSPALKEWFEKNGYNVPESFSSFGGMVEFKGVMQFKMGQESLTSLSYAYFEASPVLIELNMDKINGTWLIKYINMERYVPEQH